LDAFETNYTHDKYQFAFLAYHMLTMSFVYFNIWQIKQVEPGDFAKGLIGFGKDVEKNLLEATSPFVFSTVNERTILRFLKLIACNNGQIGTYASSTARSVSTSSAPPSAIHLDWLYAAVFLATEGRGRDGPVKMVPQIKATQEDNDLLVAYAHGDAAHVIMLEAKALRSAVADAVRGTARGSPCRGWLPSRAPW
jgi:hypothetical protein